MFSPIAGAAPFSDASREPLHSPPPDYGARLLESTGFLISIDDMTMRVENDLRFAGCLSAD